MMIADLIEKNFLAYNAGRLREACRVFEKKCTPAKVLNGFSLSGALTPAGLGIACVVPLIQHGLIDWIVSTGANLYHDMHFSLDQALYRGSPNLNDVDLKKAGLIRIYDIVFDYNVLLSTDMFIRNVVLADEFQEVMGTAELHYLLGKYALKREKELGITDRSILSAAYEHGVPIYAPSPGDSSIGMNLAAGSLSGRGPWLDTLRDVNETAAFVYDAKAGGGRSAVVILGGGAPKNFVLQTEPHLQEILGLQDAGHDYFMQFTDARPDTGGLSGATPSEAVSWGKINPETLPDTVVVYADTTITLPLMTAYILSKNISKPHKRLYHKRDRVLADLQKKAGSVSPDINEKKR